ncbi:MAG: arginyl-tRNA--protein arginylyltransferase, partial [Ferruginibacter sp.]|nr:arginyl-tRNA--protein arginylyltransferase [Ferruginibacter sp.]
KGWFRMRQTIFTTHFLHFNQRFYSAIWLRVKLDDSIYDKKFQTLSRLNKAFKTEIKKSSNRGITSQHETLFQLYRQSLSFEISPSLQELLLGNQEHNRFSSYEVNLYDGNTLIAAGFFDMGEKTAAGITCIYHPAYKKYSLGKYLMYLKMDFCRQHQLEYFYPGYMVPGYKAFDYKLEVGKNSLEYLQLSSGQWVPYSASSPAISPLQEMIEQLTVLQTCLSKNKIPHPILYYRFFEVNLDPYYYGDELFDYPVFLYCFPPPNASFYSMIVYDVPNGNYRLLQCNSVINISIQQEERTIFDTNLLKVTKQLFATRHAEEMGVYLTRLIAHRP